MKQVDCEGEEMKEVERWVFVIEVAGALLMRGGRIGYATGDGADETVTPPTLKDEERAHMLVFHD